MRSTNVNPIPARMGGRAKMKSTLTSVSVHQDTQGSIVRQTSMTVNLSLVSMVQHVLTELMASSANARWDLLVCLSNF